MSKNYSDEMITLLTEICTYIHDKKGFNVLALDVRGVCLIADYFIIAEGNVHRHVQTIVDYIQHELLRNKNIKPLHVDGKADDEWIAMDYGDIFIHVMTSEMREKYQIEQIWKAGKIISLP